MELAIPHPKRRYTVAEYFDLAEASPVKLEYKAGDVVAMAGVSWPHVQIVSNLHHQLRKRLDGGPCQVGTNDLRVWTADDRYTYPDLFVVCGQPTFLETDKPRRTLTNPTMLIEVLSPSTESDDRGEKLIRYINLPSVQEYVLVWQDRPKAQSFYRGADGRWTGVATVEAVSESLAFRSIKVEVPLADVYAKVDFGAAPAT